MRPVRLELEGFTSFRETTTVDFTDADYFVLVGPTGSGKSTIIDAICFALYGSVPRYDNRTLVAPVITQGELQTRVRFDFLVDGREYTVVRVVRRSTDGKASTREARLECGEEVLAGSAKELNEKVEELLGLTFDHFTRCVVLPQGEFAQFLHDDPKDRQGMLVKLLGLDIYEKMRKTAQERAKVAAGRCMVIEERLEQDFTEATDETLAEAKATSAAIEEARRVVIEAGPRLEELAKEHDAAETEVARLSAWLERLGKIGLPAGLADAADALQHAEKVASEARESHAAADKALGAAEKELDGLGDRDEVADAVRAHGQLAERRSALEALEDKLALARTAIEEADAVLADAERSLENAVADLESARADHAAQHLAEGLEVGEPCPVCLQEVASLPKHKKPKAIAAAEKASAAAEKALDKARSSKAEAQEALSGLLGRKETLDAQLKTLDTEVKPWPEAEAAGARLDAIEAAAAAVKEAQTNERTARKNKTEAEERLKDLHSAEDERRQAFETTRDALAELKPPAAARKNIVDDWEALLSWAAEKAAELGEDLGARDDAVQRISAEREALVTSLIETCAGCGIETGEDAVIESVIEASERAKKNVAEIANAISEAKDLRRRLKELEATKDLANSLERHLRANGFERWLVDEALHKLVAGATEILRDMSDGRYSLKVDEKGSFLVVDHHDADQTRSARTLSGGETFQASLALALSLSDRLIELAAAGSAKLEAIFLDEGFGTLDPQALGMVAGTVENLSVKGRMVGIVTHVRDLADQIPIQFRVRKEGRTSKIERVG